MSRRIVILQGAFLPVPTLLGGAVEKMWYELGLQFAAKGHTVTHVSRLFGELPSTYVGNGVRYLRIKGYDTPSTLLLLKCYDLLYSLRAIKVLPDADILISNTFFLPILLRNRRKGHIYADVQRMPRGQMRFYSRATRLRANSTAVAKAIVAECPAAEGRVRVIPNPLPFVPGKLDLASKEKVILYTGRLHPEKGLELLLKGFREFLASLGNAGLEAHAPLWRLEIAGPHETALGGGGEGYLKKVKQHSEGLPVVWHGMVRETQKLNELYQRATLFCYPSLAEKGETFGLAVLEAMAWGCVPVVSDLDCFKDFVTDGENGWVFDHRGRNPENELVKVLTKAVGSVDTRLQGNAMHVRETHSLDSIADRFLEDFELVCGNVRTV